jgi:hypothetical protein
MPLYIDEDRGHSIVATWYPNSLTSCWVPISFSSVMLSLRKKIASCHFCHDMILKTAGTMALQVGIHRLSTQFPSEKDVNKHFILKVIDSYSVTALHEFQKNKRKQLRLKRKVPIMKQKWALKQEERHQAEAYLGCQPFQYKLRQSCEEFYRILRSEWGFSPIQIYLMK